MLFALEQQSRADFRVFFAHFVYCLFIYVQLYALTIFFRLKLPFLCFSTANYHGSASLLLWFHFNKFLMDT